MLAKRYWSWRRLCGKVTTDSCKWRLNVHVFFFVSLKYLSSFFI
jgi:hypothetical protein